ncbi:GAF domain-containing protein [Flammeovirga agarivorans]|uniref:GAF domain-containing protein n=1 Tax=Flammeovirga agarivorans TaxID=2726742 RepID=A0A7X8SLW2_9BACT|nr:GAF domain-containing protein [Flammeovirga agarivorans]NLR92610.1 GAF domain-containing protein [Flammeovirga agarivorans]
MSIQQDVEKFNPSRERVEGYYSESYKLIDRSMQYTLLGMFALAIGLSFETGKWIIALGLASACSIAYFILLYNSTNSTSPRYILAFTFFLFQVQYLIVAPNFPYAQFAFFGALTLLTMYQSWTVLTIYFMLTFLMYVSLSLLGTDMWLTRLLEESIENRSYEGLVSVPLITFFYFGICLFIAARLKDQSYRNARYAIFLEDQMHIEENTKLAQDIANDKLYEKYDINENDILGNLLISMRDQVREQKESVEKQGWIASGLSSISELLLSVKDIKKLSTKTLREITEYLHAGLGAFYLYDPETEQLEISACYSEHRRKKVGDKYNVGEGQVGEVFLKNTPTLITNIPEDYTPINSGLGESLPKNIFIVPLSVNKDVVGVIEVASLREFSEQERALLTEIAPSIALTIRTINSQNRTNELLEDSQKTNDILKNKEETLKENMLLLQDTKRQMEIKQKQLEEQEEESLLFFERAMDAMIAFDEEGNILRLNPAASHIFQIGIVAEGQKIQDVLGKSFERAVNNRRTMKLKRANGDVFTALIFITEITTNEQLRRIAYIQDISEQDKKEKELRVLLDRAQVKNEQLLEQEKTMKESLLMNINTKDRLNKAHQRISELELEIGKLHQDLRNKK